MDINLDAPAFTSTEVKEPITAEASQAESEQSEREQTPPPVDGGVPAIPETEEQKVPYSRMKSVIDRARDAERRAEEAEEALAQSRSARQNIAPEHDDTVHPYNGSLPVWWVKMYGDNDVAREAYSYELVRQEQIRDEAKREAIEAVRAERSQESQILAENERTIDERLEDLSMGMGRDLTEKEELALLDIVDEYTPKDADGNYSGDLLPMDKAWEIHTLRQSQGSKRTQKSRQVPTELTSERTDGEPNNSETDNKNWNPLNWNGYRSRIPK